MISWLQYLIMLGVMNTGALTRIFHLLSTTRKHNGNITYTVQGNSSYWFHISGSGAFFFSSPLSSITRMDLHLISLMLTIAGDVYTEYFFILSAWV